MVMNKSGRAADVQGTSHLDPLALSIPDAAKRAGVSRSSIYEQIKAGNLASLKLGKRRLIRIADLDSFLESLATRAA